MDFSDKSLKFYDQLLKRKAYWVPIEPDKEQVVADEVTTTLKRALSLSKLELPVGNWVTEELTKQNGGLPSIVTTLLLSNIVDEEKHDLALNNLRKVFNVPVDYDSVTDGFISRATELADIYSPITVSAVLESSVFFIVLPMFRLLGSSPMRTNANDISNDEAIHVSTNCQMEVDLGYRRGKALDTFRSQIIDWLVTDLVSNGNPNKYLNGDFWKQSSHSLYSSGKAPGLSATRNHSIPAFFETSGTNLPIYS